MHDERFMPSLYVVIYRCRARFNRAAGHPCVIVARDVLFLPCNTHMELITNECCARRGFALCMPLDATATRPQGVDVCYPFPELALAVVARILTPGGPALGSCFRARALRCRLFYIDRSRTRRHLAGASPFATDRR